MGQIWGAIPTGSLGIFTTHRFIIEIVYYPTYWDGIGVFFMAHEKVPKFSPAKNLNNTKRHTKIVLKRLPTVQNLNTISLKYTSAVQPSTNYALASVVIQTKQAETHQTNQTSCNQAWLPGSLPFVRWHLPTEISSDFLQVSDELIDAAEVVCSTLIGCGGLANLRLWEVIFRSHGCQDYLATCNRIEVKNDCE